MRALKYLPSITYTNDPTSPSVMIILSLLYSTGYMQSTISRIWAPSRLRMKSLSSIASLMSFADLKQHKNISHVYFAIILQRSRNFVQFRLWFVVPKHQDQKLHRAVHAFASLSLKKSSHPNACSGFVLKASVTFVLLLRQNVVTAYNYSQEQLLNCKVQIPLYKLCGRFHRIPICFHNSILIDAVWVLVLFCLTVL